MPIKVIDRDRQYRFRQPNRRVDVSERYDTEPDFDCTCAFHKSLQPIALREFGDEKFLAEASLVHNLPAGVGAYLSDAVCVAVEYQPDGLSATILRQRMDSPVGATFTYQSIFRNSARMPTRLRSLVNYARFWWHARLSGRTPCKPQGLIQALVIPAALPLAIVDKRRDRPGESEVMNIIGEVKGRHCVLIDDIVDSGGTLCNAADALLDQGAASVAAYITHGVLSGAAVARVDRSQLTELVVTDTIPPAEAAKEAKRIRYLTIAPLIGEAVRRIADESSVSSLFD